MSLPLISIDQIESAFVGAFKVEHRSPNDDAQNGTPLRTPYANGRIAYSPLRQTVYIDSHRYSDAIGEFRIPEVLSQSSNPDLLPNADVVQDFSQVIDRANTANDQGMDELGGMALIGDQLFAQVYDYYDAPAQDTHTTVVVRDATQLASSPVDGFFELNGAGKTINYLSPIPKQWQSILKGDYLAGNGGGIPINGRLSIGPSLFAFQSSAYDNRQAGVVPSTEWLSYSLSKPLSSTAGEWDQYNELGLSTNFQQSNRLWTQDSSAWFGFIPIGTRTFVVLGDSGMHDSGGGYKITQTNGRLCGGPCPYDPHDRAPYYWLYDLKEVISADPTDTVLPYDYGEFNSRYVQKGSNGITGTVSGGAFDPDTGRLLLLLKSATKSFDEGSPVVTLYQLAKQANVGAIPPAIQLLIDDER